MEPLRLKQRQPVEEEVENWDDDDFLIDSDNLTFRSASTATTANLAPHRRDSTSSRLSLRSEQESCHGEERHVQLPEDDEKSTIDAITAAKKAGIPLPSNLSPSALTGGTIKRLGGRKIRKIMQEEDWENDLELPDASEGLKVKTQDHADFPETLRQVSGGSTQSSPVKLTKIQPSPAPAPISGSAVDSARASTSALSAAINLDRFKDTDDDDSFFGSGTDTIKVSKQRQAPQPVSFITPPTPQKNDKPKESEDDFEKDLQLPSDGKLKLSTRRDIPKTPSSQPEELDWGEGSLGTRYGGTRRDGRSNRSSSASALSPSVSSSFTAESEDETFDGLVLPSGPVNFGERLQKSRKSKSPERPAEDYKSPSHSSPPKAQSSEADQHDFLDGLELGDGNVFDSGKLTLHRNIKLKDTRPASPARPKTAVSLVFTNKSSTRIPRLSHERAHSTSLEPVSESGGPIPQKATRPRSRLGHSAQSSVSSIKTPSTPTTPLIPQPPTPRRREVGSKSSLSSLRNEPTTTSAQLLKQKRSLPAIRALNSPAKTTGFRPERPPSRSDGIRPPSSLRPKTPVDRRSGANDSPAPGTARKPSMPFLPAGASQSQSQHVTSKTLRHFRRHDSDNAIDLRPNSRTISRTTMRSPSPQRYRVNADTWERLSKPRNKKNFGDGHELDDFDDLPTSKESETKFLRQPISSGPKVALRNNKIYQNVLPDRSYTPAPLTPTLTTRHAGTPHFARDTAASRRARETSLAHRGPSSGPLAPVTAQRTANAPSRLSNTNIQPQQPQSSVRSKKQTKRPPQLKPHLISNLNTGKESKTVNGMFYNPETFRWEGNENALSAFDAGLSTPTPQPASAIPREKEVATPRPALITNISQTKGVQVVGGMVFDPQNMCWLKIGSTGDAKGDAGESLDAVNSIEDDDDVFKDIPDLDDNVADEEGGGRTRGRVSDIQDEWLVGEEFDVGPEFVRRQREEEDRWRKKCDKWVARGPRDREAWRWTIRELVSQFDELAM